MKYACLLIFSLLYGFSKAQDSSTLLVVANRNAKVVLDGEELGHVTKDVPSKFLVKSGEHYLQVICLCPEQIEESEILNLEEGIQRVLKIEFKSTQTSTNKNQLLVAEFDFVIPGLFANAGNENPIEYPTYYYAFEKGDELVIDLQMSNEKGTNVIEVFTYPDQNLLFTKDNFQNLSNQKISIKERGIYVIQFSTNHAFGRDVRLKLSRIPKSTETIDFNTSVVWKDVYEPVIVQDTYQATVNSTSNEEFKNGKSMITIPVNLPEGTIKWYYEFSASRNKEETNQVANSFQLFSELSKTLSKSNILSIGIDQLTKPPGSNYCNVYLVDKANFELYQSGSPYSYFLDGSMENITSGIIEVTDLLDSNLFLQIQNADYLHGVQVAIQIVAIVKKGYWIIQDK